MRFGGAALGALTALLASAALAAEPSKGQAPLIEHPEWVSRPTGEDVANAYPLRAQSAEVSGYARIRCRVDAKGLLNDCAVLDEGPVGYGFGVAALKLVPRFKLKPKTSDGLSVEGGVISIPIKFCLDDGDGASCGIAKGELAVSRVVWSAVPTQAEVAEAFAARPASTPPAHVTLSCGFNPDGMLRDCRANEAGQAQDLLDAALRLTPRFQMAIETVGDADISRLRVILPISTSGGGSSYSLAQPDWIRPIPADMILSVFPAKAAAAGLTTGRAVLDCVADAKGMMTACQAIEETPENMDFGKAAALVAAVMETNPWTDQGRPAEGAHVKFALRINQQPAAASAPAAH